MPRPGFLPLALALALIFCLSTLPSHALFPLSDTGIQFCGEAETGNTAPCSGEEPYGQDAHYGRDARALAGDLTKAGLGEAGFDYTKISNSGRELPADAGPGSGPDDWACIRDNVTSLLWEVKVDDATDPRHKDHRFAWYFSDSPDGNPGAEGGTESCAGTLGAVACTTENYVARVNAVGLCGYTDWAVPDPVELESLLHHGRTAPAIDPLAFPNTPAAHFWTAAPHAGNVGMAWSVDFNFGGIGNNQNRAGAQRVRLVSRMLPSGVMSHQKSVSSICMNGIAPTNPDDRYAAEEEGTVFDFWTGLTWKQCAEGQTWDNGDCAGMSGTFTWAEALSQAGSAVFAGHDDWRLPNLRELRGLVETCRVNPSINTTLFPNTSPATFWSSSPAVRDDYLSWFVDFGRGQASGGGRTGTGRVRLVRGGNVFGPWPGTGSLTVSIEPEEVRAAGAQWRRAGASVWRGSADTESNVPTGDHLVDFADVATWLTPDQQAVTVEENETARLTVTYRRVAYQVDVVASPSSGGTVSGGGGHDHGSEAMVRAVPGAGHDFVNWTEDGHEVSTDAEYAFEVTGPRSLTAHFAVREYAVTAAANPDLGGTVSGGGTYAHFSRITLVAHPAAGWVFVNWTEGDVGVSADAEYAFEVTGPRNLTAQFTRQDPDVNNPPVVEVRDQQIFLAGLGDTAVLDASPSFDPDGDALFFSWREDPRNPHHGLIPMVNDSLSTLHLSFPSPGRYEFTVRVSDGVVMSEETRTITVYVPGRKGVIGFTPSNALVRVPDAVVRVHATAADARNNVNPVDLAISDSLGRYVLENVEPQDNQTGRTYSAVVERPGFQGTDIVSLMIQPDPGFADGRENFHIGRGIVPTLTGIVRTPEDRPLAGAHVSIMPAAGGQVFADTTDQDGRFALSTVPKGAWLLHLRAPGHRSEVRDVNVYDDMPGLSFTMRAEPGTGTLAGRVFLAGTDRPVPGARISLGTGASVDADSRGAYAFTDIPVGDYILTVTRAGFAPSRLPVVPVRVGENPLDLALSYAGQGPTVFGTVTDATSGAPVRLVTVGVTGTAGLLIRSGVSDYTGFYQLRDVPTGEQTFRVFAPGYATKTFSLNVASGMEQNIALERGTNWTAPGLPGRDRPTARVAEAFIFLDNLRQSATLDARPSEGASPRHVWREGPDNPILGLLPANPATQAVIQISGFRKPGVYIFELQVDSDGRLSANTATIMVFAPGLSGNVHASPTDGIIGLNAATVRAYAGYAAAAEWNDDFVESTQTADNPMGDFTLAGLSPGTWWVVARAASDTGFRQYGPVPRRVNHGSAVRDSHINMPREEFSLSGMVTDAVTDQPLENVRIVVAPGSLSESYRTTTDATGRYRLPVVPRGSGQPVMLLREGYTTRALTLDISGDTTRNIVLTPEAAAEPATLTGRVTADYQGILLPVFNAEVIIGSGLYRTFTNADGSYEIANLPPGLYHGTIRKPGYVPRGLADAGFVELLPGENTIDKLLTFAAQGPVIRGTVINARHEPIPGVTIRVLQPGGPFAAWAGSPAAGALLTESSRQRTQRSRTGSRAGQIHSDPGGIFQMPDLPHGTHQIEARLPDGRVSLQTIHVDGNLKLVLSEDDFAAVHVLTYTAGPGGRIEGETTQTVPNGGNGASVRAIPDPGFHFVRWSDGLTTEQRQDTNVETGIAVTAEFAANPEVVVIPAVPGGGGRVEGGGNYRIGALVEFRAVADSGHAFSHWTLNGQVVPDARATHTFTVSEDMFLEAHFKEVKGLPGVLMLLLE